MTNYKYNPFFLGSDRLWKQFDSLNETLTKSIPSYPPYNIKKVDENRYVIEMAVAGFGKSNLDITLEDGKLIVKGNVEGNDGVEFLHKGIANRPFTREFTLADTVVVNDADMLNGMLRIFLENVIPESKKSTKVDIKDAEETSTSQYLTE